MVDASAIAANLYCKPLSSLAMNPQHNPQNFPLWAYLKQPVFSSHYKLQLNPWAFWHFQRLRYLERCWL